MKYLYFICYFENNSIELLGNGTYLCDDSKWLPQTAYITSDYMLDSIQNVEKLKDLLRKSSENVKCKLVSFSFISECKEHINKEFIKWEL